MINYECKNACALRRLIKFNEKSRVNASAELTEQFHKACGEYVKLLADKKCGVVSTNFGYLFKLGKGKSGDEICLMTHNYASLLLKEETSKDINDLLNAEKIERKIWQLNE